MRSRPNRDGNQRAALTETLTQELGHLLGLEHSTDKMDIMYQSAHAHWHQDLEFVQLTKRDFSALRWLYSQTSYVRIVPDRAQDSSN